jgi:hypothetical protein
MPTLAKTNDEKLKPIATWLAQYLFRNCKGISKSMKWEQLFREVNKVFSDITWAELREAKEYCLEHPLAIKTNCPSHTRWDELGPERIHPICSSPAGIFYPANNREGLEAAGYLAAKATDMLVKARVIREAVDSLYTKQGELIWTMENLVLTLAGKWWAVMKFPERFACFVGRKSEPEPATRYSIRQKIRGKTLTRIWLALESISGN